MERTEDTYGSTINEERKCKMSNVIEQLTPNPVNHKHGENGCCKTPRAWEMEMMHQVWAAGLHDAANCFQDALEAKWKLESQRKVKPKTNGDRIRAMSDSEYTDWLCDHLICGDCPVYAKCGKESRKHGEATTEDCFKRLLGWLKAPVEDSEK